MSDNKGRFFIPILFFIAIGGTAAFIIYYVTSGAISSNIMFLSQMNAADFVLILLAASIPILILEYSIFAIPLAGVFLIVNRFLKAASYEMNIMNIGRVFHGRHMIRRAAAPALFSVASSDMLRGIIENAVYVSAPTGYEFLHDATLSLMAALLFMPLALLIFMPTWVLNDSGIVTHLKENKLEIRQCPDTQGVGRWVSSIFGGYALIAFPITMINTHLYEPYIAEGVSLTIRQLLNASLLILGLPLFVMAFIMPVILFNERSQHRVRTKMAALATRLGATIIKKEKIEKVTRITSEGILTEEGGKEIISTAKTIRASKTEREVVSSRKAISKKKDGKKKVTKKKKKT